MIRRARTLLLLLLLPLLLAGRASATSPKVSAQPRSVAVIFALKSQREHLVPWRSDLTLDAAIQSAARSQRLGWKEAWRYRQSFWTRNFRNPHSFWARLLAGEKATGYVYFQNTGQSGKAAALQPGDRIYVDLAPIY